MNIGKICGWLLVGLAIAFAAAETGAQGVTKQYGIMSAYNVFHSLIPGELIQTRIFIEKNIHPVLWDPIIRSLLWLPGWLLLGAPGALLVWKLHLKPASVIDPDDDVVVSSYDDILAAAEELDDFYSDEDDSAPSKYGHINDFDPTTDNVVEGPADELAALKLDPKNKKN
jgi:hypothetical protein